MSNYHILLGSPLRSSWSLRGWLALELLRLHGFINFSHEFVDWESPKRKNEIFAKGGGARKVPVLFDGSQVIWESLIICDYLASKHPKANLWGDNPKAFWFGKILAGEIYSGFPDLRRALPMEFLRECSVQDKKISFEPEVQRDIDRIHELWDDAFQRFSGKFLLGEQFSICDIMFAPVVSRFVTYGVAHASNYLETVMQHPAMVNWRNLAQDYAKITQNLS